MTTAQQPEAFDAATLGTSKDAEQPQWFEIASNKDGRGTGIQFQLVGRDSRQYRTLNRKLQNRRLEEMSRTRKLKLTAEQTEVETLSLVAACVMNFRSRAMKRDATNNLVPVTPEEFLPVIKLSGTSYEFSPESVENIFKTVPEIKEQIEDFLSDRANFLKESTTP